MRDVTGCADDEKTKYVALLFLKLQESCMLSRSTVQTVFDNLKQTVELAGCNAMQAVNAVCLANGIAEDVCSQIVNAAA
jgi:hypothetical protein